MIKQLTSFLFLPLFMSAIYVSIAQTNQKGAGNCLQFGGTSGYVDFGDTVVTGFSEASVTGWFKINGLPNDWNTVIVDLNDPDVNPSWNILTVDGTGSDAGSIHSWITNSSGNLMMVSPAEPKVNDGKWHHFAVVYQPNLLEVYIDGALVGQRTGFSTAIPEQKTWIGDTPLRTYNWDGEIDEVRFWKKALTQQEVRINMSQKLKGGENSLVGYWRFDKGTGTVADDSSPNNNDGTLK